jgi:multidrug resistance efflux pump
MPEYDIESPKPRAKIYGVLLAGLIAVVSLVLVAITHEPKTAVSSPAPVKAAIVPQIADAKSEAEILFRGKSFASFKRAIVMYYQGEITDIVVNEGQTVKAGDTLGSYVLDRASMMEVHTILYPDAVLGLKRALYEQEITRDKLKNVSLALKQLQLDTVKKELEDLRQLAAKDMAHADAVKNKERQLEATKKEIQEVKDSIKQTVAAIKKTKDDLRFAEARQKRSVDLLEWQTNRSYSDSSIPLNKAFLKAPISGQIIWMSPLFRVKSELKKGFHALTLAPMHSTVVRCKVHELDLVKLKAGDRGTVTFDAFPEKKFVCRVTRIPWVSRNPALEVPADYEIECALEDPDGMLKEGLTCNVKVSITD